MVFRILRESNGFSHHKHIPSTTQSSILGQPRE